MKRARDICILIAAIAFFVGMVNINNIKVSFAAKPRPSLIADDLDRHIPPLLEWLKAQGYEGRAPELIVRVDLPTLRMITRAATRAMGACSDGVIYVTDTLHFEDDHQRSLLLHELVHVQQDNCATPRDFEERKQHEAEAYAMQEKWFHEKTGLHLLVREGASLN